jgi:hypothetical protein
MAKRRPKPAAGAEPQADRHKNPLISTRPSAELAEAVRQLAAEERRSVSQMLVILAEEALAARGRWTPPSPPKGE